MNIQNKELQMVNNTKVNKRIKGAQKYMNDLQQEYSKLNIVRVDLAYEKPYSNIVTLEEANSDLARMFNNTRSKPTVFEGKVGYIVKREYTKDKGVHFHAIFIYDGQKVQKDAFKADQIGEYWAKEITQKKGCFHNCNRNEYKYKGVGMLDHRDGDKRKILDEVVVRYLCKDEQDINPVKENKKDRAFTRGTITKSKEKLGRPRVTS